MSSVPRDFFDYLPYTWFVWTLAALVGGLWSTRFAGVNNLLFMGHLAAVAILGIWAFLAPAEQSIVGSWRASE